MDISYPLGLWSPEKKRVLFALERRAFKANKPEKWQTLYNEELPENTHSVNLKDKPGLEKGGTRKYEKSLRN